VERRKLGDVFHYFSKIGVAAINLTDADLKVGDTIESRPWNGRGRTMTGNLYRPRGA